MDEVVAADRTELAGAKHAGDRRAAKALGNDPRVVVGLGETGKGLAALTALLQGHDEVAAQPAYGGTPFGRVDCGYSDGLREGGQRLSVVRGAAGGYEWTTGKRGGRSLPFGVPSDTLSNNG